MTVELSCAALAAGVAERLRGRDAGRFAGIRLPDHFHPRTLLDDPRRYGVRASYERPDSDFTLVAVGEAGAVDVDVSDGARNAAAQLLRAGAETEAHELRPRLLGGFAFDATRQRSGSPWTGFGRGRLLLPRLLFVRSRAANGVVLAPGVPAGELTALLRTVDEDGGSPIGGGALDVLQATERARWLAAVSAIAAGVRAGRYEKAVLATALELGADEPIDTGAALGRLRAHYPHCHVFSFTAGDATFLGASPELLVSLQGGEVRALALAGSARRGETPEEDDRRGRALMESAKDRAEHRTVLRAILEALGEFATQVRAPQEPQLRKFRNIQHLATPISGRALPGVDVLDLVGRLHPTPAVCGWPTEVARAVIAEHEDFDRGWYAGPIGWLDAAGDGEFAVALRAALVRGRRAWLFAGNGIMGDSDPASELAEVELKFQPLADALAGTAP